MNNFWKRAITGLVFISVLIASAVVDKLILATLFLFFTLVGTREYYAVVNTGNAKVTNTILGYFLSVSTFSLIVAVSYFHFPIGYLALLIPIVFLIFVVQLFKPSKNGFLHILQILMPSLYVALPFSLFIISNEMLQLSDQTYSPQLTLVFFFTLWSNDTGAYLAGKSFGKTKLFPSISPNKTWEGTIGGAVLAIFTAYNCSIYFTCLSSAEWVVLSLIVVIFGSLGDLVESMLKRTYQVKDSGNILPGHGGILDRFDGLLIAAPMVFTFLVILDLLD